MSLYFSQKNLPGALKKIKSSRVKNSLPKIGFEINEPHVKCLQDTFILHKLNNGAWRTFNSNFGVFRRSDADGLLHAHFEINRNSSSSDELICDIIVKNPAILFITGFWVMGSNKQGLTAYFFVKRSDGLPIPIPAAYAPFTLSDHSRDSRFVIVTCDGFGIFEILSTSQIPAIIDYNRLDKWNATDLSLSEKLKLSCCLEDNNYVVTEVPFVNVIDKNEYAFKNLDTVHYGPLD